MNVRDNYEAEKYTARVPRPERPRKPPILEKRAGVLTPDELASLPSVVAEYEAAKVAYDGQLQAYRRSGEEAVKLLRADLEIEHGVVGHEKADKLWDIAWGYGRSSGFMSVVDHYETLVELL